MQSLAIPPVSLRDAHISTLYGTFLGAHFVLIKLFRRLQASYHFDESDGDELFKILLDASRKKLPSSTVMSLLTSSIYGGLCPTSWSKKWVVGLLDEAEKQYLEALKTSSASKDRVSLSQFIAAVRDVETSLHKRSEKYQIQDWLDRLSSLFRSTTDDMLVKDINDQLSQFANTYFNIPDWRSASESPTITTSIRFYGSLKRAMAEFDSSKMVCKAMIMKAFQSSSIWESCWKNEKDSTGYSNSLQKLQTVSLRFMEWMLSETQKDTLICTNIIDAIILNMFDFAFQQNVPVDHVVVISPPTNKGTLSILGPDFYSAIPEYTNRTREFFSNISRIDMGLQISTESSIAEKLEIKLPGVPINAKSVPITNSSCLGMTRMSVEISGLELTDSRFVDGAFIQTKPEMIKHQTGRNRRKNALVAPPNDFIVYVSSTPDAFIERNLLTVAIMPHLKRTLCSLGLRLQIVDLQRKLDSCSREDYLHSAKFWIERSSLCIIFFGGTIMCGKVMDKSGLPDNVVESEIGMILRLGTSTITLIRDNAFVRSVPRSYKRRFETEETMELDKVSTLRQAVFSMVGGNPKTYTFSFSHIEDQDLVMRNTEELQEIVTQLVSDKVNLYAARTELRCPQQFSGTLLPSRNSALQKIKRLILENRDGGSGLFLITGTSGVGKTALLSTLVQEVQPEFIVLDSFAGSWNGSHRITQVLQKFVYLLQIHLRNDKVAPILRDGEIHSHYLDLLRRTVFLGHKIIIVIDAAEEISFEADSHAHWLPKLQELDRETWRNIRWIVSSENSRITEEIQRRGIRHHHTRLDTISEVEKMQLFDTLQAHENTDLLQRMRNSPDANLPFFTTLCNHVFGLMMTGESLPSSAIDIDTLLTWWIKSMERLHGQALVRDLFSLIEVARDGLSHEDLVELLSISTIRLSKMVSQTQALIQVSSSGQLHYSTSKVRTVIRRRYLEDEAYVSGLHRQIASHFSFICDPYNNKSWMGYYEFRSADIIHHWLLTGRNLQDTVDTLCSLPFLESCFKNRSDHELIKFFTMAMKESAALDEQNHFKRLNEYSSFIQKHSATLRRTTACITSLALSHSVSGQMIYEDALASKKLWSEQAVIGCMTPLGDNLNTVSMGKHNSNVIYVGAFQLKSLGKCCITVSDDGAVKAWDLDSFLCVGDVLEAPYPPGHIIKCAFSLTGTDRVILANAKGSICMHDLETKELLLGLEYAYKNGAIFFSDDNHGFWQQNTEGTVIFTPFQNHLETMRLSDSSLCLSGSQTSTLGQKFEMNAFLAQSNDGAKIAVLSSKYGGLLVLNAHKMSEICRFKDPLVSAKSIGQFSVSKDLLALTLDSGNIMIWRIDNHSRVSLLNTAEVKVQSLAFSSDETLLYVGTSDGDLLIMDILTGVITKKIALDTGKSRILMCVTTSYGKERFFFAAEQSVMMSDVKQTISYSTSAAIVEFEEPGSASVRQLFLADSGEYNVVSLLSTGELCFWSKNDVVKRLALREGSHLETSGFHSASGIFVYLAQGYLVIFSLKDEREILRRAMDRIVKEVRIETFCQKEGDSLFVALLTISEELLGYILTESCGTWSLKQILERKKVTIVPRTPLQAGTDRLLIGSVDKTIVINIKTGKQVFERRSLSDEKIKDLMWFNPEDPQGMGDQIAFLTEDSLHAGDEVWSSGLPFAVPLILENFDFCQEIGRLAYLGTQTIEVLDHTLGTLRPHSYSVLNVIQTLPSRKRLGSLDHDKAQISKWCILPTRRHLLSLTATGVMRVWDMESLELLGALPLPGTFRTREMRVSFSGQEPLIYLTDGTKILVFRLWLPVPMVQS